MIAVTIHSYHDLISILEKQNYRLISTPCVSTFFSPPKILYCFSNNLCKQEKECEAYKRVLLALMELKL